MRIILKTDSGPVIVNDGWVHTISNIITLHDYDPSGDRFRAQCTDHKDAIVSRALYFSNDEAGWSYSDKAASTEDFVERFDSIVTADKELPYSCGYCYTQMADVQQEINERVTP